MRIMHAKSKHIVIPLGLVAATLLSGGFLMSGGNKTHAVESKSSQATVTVGVSCTMTGTVITAHDAMIISGQAQENIGQTRLKTICNDTGGYAIYAVGFSGDTYGNTDMLGATSATPISTGAWTTTGDSSVWGMKLTGDSESYGYGNLTIASGYNANHAIPTDYTKVVDYTSSTDGVIGSSVFTTYAAYVSQTQPADTYTGKVKYLMVHPNSVNPTGLIINFDTTMIQSVAVHAGSADGAVVATVTTNGGVASGLKYGVTYYLVPTFKSGYEFNSWEDGTDSAGTMGATDTETTTYAIGEGANSVTLVGQEMSIQYIQNMTLASCQSNVVNGIGDEIDVVDARDGESYKVRYINGACWMTQNLRFLGNTGSATGKMTLTSDTSNGASGTIDLYSLNSSNAGSFGAYANHCDSTNGYNYACVYDSGSDTTGVWYNYAAATANNIKTNSNQTAASASGPSICPAGWHLPTGAVNNTSSEFYKLFQSTSSSWIATNSYLTAFNAVPGGRYYDGSLLSAEYGYWWSATAYNATRRYGLDYNSSNTQFYSDNNYRRYGYFVRCVRTS